MNETQLRQPRGRPVGGQFAAKANPEADLELDPVVDPPVDPPAPTPVDPSGVVFGGMDKTERIKAMHAEIENALTNMSDHEGWQKFLDSTAQFHRYSFGNTMLVLSQRKDATRVAGFNDCALASASPVLQGRDNEPVASPSRRSALVLDVLPNDVERRPTAGCGEVRGGPEVVSVSADPVLRPEHPRGDTLQ